MLHDLGLGKGFLDNPSKAGETKAKISKPDNIKLKNFYSKENNQQSEEKLQNRRNCLQIIQLTKHYYVVSIRN